MHALLLSTYELGRQPFGLASPAAWLREAGVEVSVGDLSRTRLDETAVRQAALIGVFLPMHTATRLALPVIARLRALNPAAHLCAYGLYAPANESFLRDRGVDTVLGVEFESQLVELAAALAADAAIEPAGFRASPPAALPRLRFRVPDRSGLPPLDRYASLQWPDGTSRVAGYTEASRGCKHRCRHCPVVPVYDGRFRVVTPQVVIDDVKAQLAAGATHITFGDPDFFNGIGHARRVVRDLAEQCSGVTYDVTIKVEHLLTHAGDLPLLRDTGCVLVTSAVEAVDDDILRRLEKGHSVADFERAAALMNEVRLPLAPTFVTFTPWTTIRGYVDLLRMVERLGLVGHVAPIQWAIRLLVPAGSRLLELPEMCELLGPYDAEALAYPWTHPDERVDDLQRRVASLVGGAPTATRAEIFEAVHQLAISSLDDASTLPPRMRPAESLPAPPHFTEPWYCCAEPTEGQAALL